MFLTYQTKLKNEIIVLQNGETENAYNYFVSYAHYFGKLERKLFVDLYVRRNQANAMKKLYCAQYQITSRQYNSIKSQLDGRVQSKKELQKLYIEERKQKIKHLQGILERKALLKQSSHEQLLKMKGNEKSFPKKVKNYRRLRMYIHQKKRKIHQLQLKLAVLKKDVETGVIRLCFGSKLLFKKQFHLEANNLTFAGWKKQWQEKRAEQFTFVGSKDETYGNQSCTYDSENNLRIRVTSKDESKYGKYIIVPNVLFPYGQVELDKAKIPYVSYTKGKGEKKNYYKALTCKFIQKNNQWYLNMSVDVQEPEVQTIEDNGAIGVDFNVNFLAVSEVDRYGNYLTSFNIPFKGYQVSSEQAKQSLSEALKVVTEYALEKQKPIIREELEFKKKKLQLKEFSTKQARMLSGLSYSMYKNMLDTKCKKIGVAISSVNPAFTSQIGHHKFMRRYGLSSHESAAMAIARKGLQFKRTEKVPASHILKNQIKVSTKKRTNQWAELTKQWKTYSFKQKNYLLCNTMN
ncbi:IS200/IS605 family accessory protein TnpB-related protein [Sporosarcina sp. YIM B06819]|uniref:IS200/IS605 family accessory protein TnpB-related protein n=1 Tax=Sporosarcina sp. YIM B06819 TaxID=3081769 RepID=UPI00298CC9C5|nr:IS200/IS605 family accessory protein TnpB-related protein [Sporosarcina sp. YIM B06819]